MKTITRIVLVAAAGLALAVPAHAASRAVQINADIFGDRCAAQGGLLQSDGATYLCQTPAIDMLCKFVAPSAAQCAWAGIDNTRAVVRLIGMSSGAVPSNTGGIAYKPDNGGGIDLPDLPIDNGGGGGGIDLPDLPIDNGNGGGGGIDLPDLPIDNGNGGGGGIDLPDLPVNNN